MKKRWKALWILILALWGSAMLEVGLWRGSSLAHEAALTMEKEWGDSARFKLGDEGVSRHLSWADGQIYEVWMRCDRAYVNCYWSASDGRYGIGPHSHRFPWLEVEKPDE